MSAQNETTPMVAKLALEWPMALPSLANARFGHWRQRHAKVKAQRLACDLALRANGVGWRLQALEPGGHMLVWLERQSPRMLDDDNLRGALKPTRDSVAAFFGVPDNHRAFSWCYRQTKGPAMVRIEFEVLTADEAKAIRARIGDNAREVMRMAELAGVL